MIWIYISVVILVIQLYVLTHTYTVESIVYWKQGVDFNKAERLEIPVWMLLLMVLLSSIPIISIFEFVVFWIIWIIHYYGSYNGYGDWYTYWIFKDKFFSKKI